jgi:hypothetical protein
MHRFGVENKLRGSTVSSDNQFTALGPTVIGFQTNGANIQTGADIAGNDDGVRGSCGAGLGESGAGVRGTSSAQNSNGVIAIANSGENAYALWAQSSSGFAGNFDGKVNINGSLRVDGRLDVTGTKAAVVSFPDGSIHRLYAVESPDSWFEDFGFGQLVDGHATIQLDSDFASVVNDDPYHVFITEYEDNNALYVTARTSSGFEVRAKTSGASGQFSYRVAAKRKNVNAMRFDEVALHAATKSLDEKSDVPQNAG